jgi:hypothetical protein
VLTLGARPEAAGAYGIAAQNPDLELRIDIADDVRIVDAPVPAGAPCLRGTAAELVEALSIRAPLPGDTPPEWRVLAAALADVFDTELAT